MRTTPAFCRTCGKSLVEGDTNVVWDRSVSLFYHYGEGEKRDSHFCASSYDLTRDRWRDRHMIE